MKRQLLFVHGGGEEAYEEDRKLAASLRDALGGGYEVQCPKMPDDDSPQYAAWRDRIASELAELDGEVFLVGHSLGASILLKYISEERTATPIAGTFLVAAPYWGVEDWEVDEYVLQEDFASKLPEGLPMFFYHSPIDDQDEQSAEVPGRSTFLREGDSVFHTYSVYARGLETVGGSYYFLDETALGRQEDWEEPKGRAVDARGAVPDFSS
jgi:uncharacterized protein